MNGETDGAGVRRMPMGTACVCHTHREQVPIELHHVWPLGMGGPNIPDNKISVCTNAHYSIHALLDLMLKSGGNVPWEVRRKFGRKVRLYAESGYRQATAE